MEDDDLKLLRGFADGRTDERTDICDCRVAFATENQISRNNVEISSIIHCTIQMSSYFLKL